MKNTKNTNNTPRSQPPRAILHVADGPCAHTASFLVHATRELLACGVPQVLLYARTPDTPSGFESTFDPRVRLIELPPLRAGLLAHYRALRAALQFEIATRPCAAVHLHAWQAGLLGRFALARMRPRPPLFYSPHGDACGNAYGERRGLVAPWLVRGLERLAARIDDCTPVAGSRSEADLLRRLTGRHAHVLEHALDDACFAIPRRPVLSGLEGPSTRPPLVLSIGRVCRQASPESFAELAARFQIAEIPATFVWVGSGDAASEARLRAAGVNVTGEIDAHEERRWLGEASVYVQTSSRSQGMPLQVLRALAAGVPCVVKDIAANRDAVRQGITGYVTRRTDEMVMVVQRLTKDRSLHRRMSVAAMNDAAERFGGAALRERLCRLYGLLDRDVLRYLDVDRIETIEIDAVASYSPVPTPAPARAGVPVADAPTSPQVAAPPYVVAGAAAHPRETRESIRAA